MIFLIFLLFPFYWMIITTFGPMVSSTSPGIGLITGRSGRGSDYGAPRYLLATTRVWMWNTAHIAVVSTAISLFAAYLPALSRLNFKGAACSATIFVTYLGRRRCCSFRCPRSYAPSLGDTPWSLILSYPT